MQCLVVSTECEFDFLCWVLRLETLQEGLGGGRNNPNIHFRLQALYKIFYCQHIFTVPFIYKRIWKYQQTQQNAFYQNLNVDNSICLWNRKYLLLNNEQLPAQNGIYLSQLAKIIFTFNKRRSFWFLTCRYLVLRTFWPVSCQQQNTTVAWGTKEQVQFQLLWFQFFSPKTPNRPQKNWTSVALK